MAQARPRTPSEQRYSEPLINTSFIIVMVLLLSTTITILNLMRGVVLLLFGKGIDCAVLSSFNRSVATHWKSEILYGSLFMPVKKGDGRARWIASSRGFSAPPIACDDFRECIVSEMVWDKSLRNSGSTLSSTGRYAMKPRSAGYLER